MIGPTNWKNQLIFSAAPVLDMDSGAHFHSPHHCGGIGILDVLALLIQSPADFHNTRRND